MVGVCCGEVTEELHCNVCMRWLTDPLKPEHHPEDPQDA